MRRLVITTVLAFVAVVALTAVKHAYPSIGAELPFSLYLGVVLAAAWSGGRVPAVVTVLTVTVASNYFFLGHRGTIDFDAVSMVQTAVFLAESAVAVALVEVLRRGRDATLEASSNVEKLQALTAALGGARTLEDVADVVTTTARSSLGATLGSLYRTLEDGSLLMLRAEGMPAKARLVFERVKPDAEVPAALALRDGSSVYLNDREAYRTRFPEVARGGLDMEAGVALPLRVATRCVGVVGFRFPEAHAFDARERRLLETFAAQVAQAFDRGLGTERERVKRVRLDVLSLTAEALSLALSVDEVARVVVDRGIGSMGADTCSLHVMSDDEDALLLVESRGIRPALVERIRRIPRESPHFSWLVDEEPVWVESAAEYARLVPGMAALEADGPRAQAFWSTVLMVEGRRVGLLSMGYFEERTFVLDERAFMQTFARQCGQALLRARRLEAETAARRAAEEAQGLLSTTLRSIGEAVVSTDPDGLVTFVNPVAEELTGRSASEARGRPLEQILPLVQASTRRPLELPLARVLREGRVGDFARDALLVTARGVEVPVEASAAPIGSAPQVRGVVIVFRSVAEEKQAEARQALVTSATSLLAESLDDRAGFEALASLLVPRLGDGCFVDLVPEPGRNGAGSRLESVAVAHVTSDGLAAARALRARYPLDPAELPGVARLLFSGEPEHHGADEEAFGGTADTSERAELYRRLHVGESLIVPLVARKTTLGLFSLVRTNARLPFSDEERDVFVEIARRAAVAVDNARLFRGALAARAVADDANRLKDEFLATMSHELRTPLHAILGWARLLVHEDLDPTKRVRAVETIERNAERMAGLVEDVLDVSRIVAGKVHVEMRPFELAALVEGAVESARPAAQDKSVTLTLSASPVLVRGDEPRMEQVVTNLIGNALKFTPSGGHVRVSVGPEGRFGAVRVVDSGVGIAAEFLPFVFDPFRQGDGRITRSHGGLGLGLAISKHLVGLHGGRLEASSEGVGRGATFELRVPCASVEAAERTPDVAKRASSRAIAASESSRHVLVVDDDEDARTLVKSILERSGARVSVASSVEEGMASFESDTPDVVVSDIGMPGEDGLSFVRRLRARGERGRDVLTIALTAFARESDRMKSLEAGFDAHLTKPVDPAQLVATVSGGRSPLSVPSS